MNRDTLIKYLEKINSCKSGIYDVSICKDLKSLYDSYDDADYFLWLLYRIEPDRRKFVSLYYDILKKSRLCSKLKCVEEYIETGVITDKIKKYVYLHNSNPSYEICSIIYGSRYITIENGINNDYALREIRKRYNYRRIQYLLNRCDNE